LDEAVVVGPGGLPKARDAGCELHVLPGTCSAALTIVTTTLTTAAAALAIDVEHMVMVLLE